MAPRLFRRNGPCGTCHRGIFAVLTIASLRIQRHLVSQARLILRLFNIYRVYDFPFG